MHDTEKLSNCCLQHIQSRAVKVAPHAPGRRVGASFMSMEDETPVGAEQTGT